MVGAGIFLALVRDDFVLDCGFHMIAASTEIARPR